MHCLCSFGQEVVHAGLFANFLCSFFVSSLFVGVCVCETHDMCYRGRGAMCAATFCEGRLCLRKMLCFSMPGSPNKLERNTSRPQAEGAFSSETRPRKSVEMESRGANEKLSKTMCDVLVDSD